MSDPKNFAMQLQLLEGDMRQCY